MTTPKTIRKQPLISEAGNACACASSRKAVAVDPAIKSSILRRLARIEGQVRGLQKMVESERYCADILVQVGSVQQALRGVSRQLMHNHLKNCAADAIRKGTTSADQMYDELLDLVYLHSR